MLRRKLKITETKQEAEYLGDLRFRALLSQAEWQALPLAVQKRFSKRLAGLRTVIYRGRIETTRMNRVGWLLAQFGRLIGGPLPLKRDSNVPAVVTVTEDPATGGQFWSRHYNHHQGFPQVIHSSKRFHGVTGLEEYVGGGIGMALTIHVENEALLFRSAYYFLAIGKRRIKLPSWLAAGKLKVTHQNIDDNKFIFALEIIHPLFGELIYQRAIFEEATP